MKKHELLEMKAIHSEINRLAEGPIGGTIRKKLKEVYTARDLTRMFDENNWMIGKDQFQGLISIIKYQSLHQRLAKVLEKYPNFKPLSFHNLMIKNESLSLIIAGFSLETALRDSKSDCCGEEWMETQRVWAKILTEVVNG